MFAIVRYIILLALLIQYGDFQSVFTVPNASDGVGTIAFPFICKLTLVAALIFLLASRQNGDQTEDLNDACEALFEDSEVTEAKEQALDHCRGCTDLNEEDCESNSNCAYEDGTCFIRGDKSVVPLYCSLIHADPARIARCQACFGLPEEICNESSGRDCNFIEATGICTPDTDGF